MSDHDKIANFEEVIAKKDAEIARLVSIINSECNKCCDCAKFGGDCSAGDVEGNEDRRACEKFISKQIAAKDAEIAALREIVKEIARGFLEYENTARFCEYGGRGVRYKGSVTTAFWHESADIAKKARGFLKNVAKSVSLAEENAKLRGLVSDLADRLRNNPCLNCGDDGFCTTCNDAKITDSLVDKAREVLGEGK